ncbi:hypothetical protein E4U54_001249 [Claviceps lovelessii]|nr:hypothetical protein E4U54_001249 [Claviceps lovelessii]
MYQTNAATSTAQLSPPRPANSSATTSDDGIVKLVDAVKSHQTHSFQIVRLQNQIEAIRNENSRREEEKEHVLQELHRSREEIAYLKGRLAGHIMEFYLTPPDAKLEEKRSQNNSVDFSPDPRPEARPPPVFGGFEDRTSQVGHAAGIVADQLLMEQRPALIRALVRQSALDSGKQEVSTYVRYTNTWQGP